MKLVEVVLENITGPFEGGGYDNVSSNFDGMGVSAGILQWCYGQGSLQSKILLPYIKKHGSIDALKIFPKLNVNKTMDDTARMDSSIAKKFAAVHMNTQKGILKKSWHLKPEWEAAWKKFLSLPTVITLQKEACNSLDREAKYLCFKWKLNSKIAYCWMFDILTQNGSLLGIQRPLPNRKEVYNLIELANSENKKVWSTIDVEKLTDEQVILFIASHARAAKARAEYKQDVFSRKGTIALGKGVVHGKKFDLKDTYSIVTLDTVV